MKVAKDSKKNPKSFYQIYRTFKVQEEVGPTV